MTKKRPAKLDPQVLLARVREAGELGNYIPVDHAEKRLQEREVTIPELVEILKKGYLLPRSDKWREDFQAWNYAVRGKTLDGRSLRLAVAVASPDLLIITVIDLDKKDLN